MLNLHSQAKEDSVKLPSILGQLTLSLQKPACIKALGIVTGFSSELSWYKSGVV